MIVGARSQIGAALRPVLAERNWRVTGTDRRQGQPGDRYLDLSRPLDLRALPADVDIVFLLAGVTSIAACEADPDGTAIVNVSAPATIARHCASIGARAVMVSTNLVLDGTIAQAPVTAAYAPSCIYGRQKVALEQTLLDLAPGATILRVTKIAETLLPLLGEWKVALLNRQRIRPFHDLHCCPLRLADAVACLVGIAENGVAGVVHCSGEGDVSYVDIALRLTDHLRLSRNLVLGTTSTQAGMTLAVAPRHTTLDMTDFADRFKFMPAGLDETLSTVFDLIP
ncbi:NAD(P)-dependent oxidoreductase [Dongia sp.]|uniref:SDR family oxidoreductase n=1 Tax=Dongia sp. TaxID=1977262 RepID=UPI0035B10468